MNHNIRLEYRLGNMTIAGWSDDWSVEIDGEPAGTLSMYADELVPGLPDRLRDAAADWIADSLAEGRLEVKRP